MKIMKFEEIKFNIPDLVGISKKSTEEHLKLYAGYVKHANLILEKIEELSADQEKNAYLLGELQRRFGFEYDGIRNHEFYFKAFENGPKSLPKESKLLGAIENEWGSFEKWLARFKAIALTRGVGWAMLFYDPVNSKMLNAWVDEQHLGHLTHCNIILALDMWEHSFVYDYQPSGKKNYVEDFNCFNSKTSADIVVNDVKVIGSAQCRKKRAFLQHGSIKLDKIRELSGKNITSEMAVSDLKIAFEKSLKINFQDYSL